MQWHTLAVEAYGMTHTALHGRVPRILWRSGNIQLYTRINLRAYGATPTTLQHSTDTVRSHGVDTLRAASSVRSGRRVRTIASWGRQDKRHRPTLVCVSRVQLARSAVDICLSGARRGAAVGLLSHTCLLYTSPSPRDGLLSRMPSSA